MFGMDQSIILLVKRSVARGLRSALREHHWLAAFGTLFGVFLILQILLFGLTGMQTIRAALQSRTDLQLEMRQGATDQERQEFYASLQQLPYVEQAVYITKEQTYEYTRVNDPELVAFLEKFNMENPFSDTIGVSLTSLEAYGQLTDFIGLEEWRNVINPALLSEVVDQKAHVHEMLRIMRTGQSLAVALLFLTSVVIFLIVMELVRRRSLDCADEVFAEQLAGAHPIVILLPFATEASILLWIAIIFSSLTLVIILAVLPFLPPPLQGAGLMEALGSELAARARSFLPIFFAFEILLAPVVAVIGARLGIRPTVRSGFLTTHKN